MLEFYRGYESTIASFDIDFTKPGERGLMMVEPYEVYELRHVGLLCRYNANCKHVRLLAKSADGRAYTSISYWELYAGGNIIPNPAVPWVSAYDEIQNVYLMMWTPATPYISPPGMSLSILIPKGEGTATIDYTVTVRRLT